MYTRFLRRMVRLMTRMAGHCEEGFSGSGHCGDDRSGSGHCY